VCFEVSILNSIANQQYLQITDLHFAVWNMIKPVNFIWVDVKNRCVKVGSKDEATDTVQDIVEAKTAAKEAYIELISYDENGTPILRFDEDSQFDDGYTTYKAKAEDLVIFLSDMEDIGLLEWKNYPSLREGVCWRIDVHYIGGEKHISGQSRFPAQWTEFGKALNGLIKKVQSDSAKSDSNE